MVDITISAKDYRCVCGKKGEFLNINFSSKWGIALCRECRDKALAQQKEAKR